MVKKSRHLFILLFLFIFVLVGCNEEENWEQAATEEMYDEILSFMEDYRTSWEESLRMQNFSMMERFFVPNSQVFHMQRRQHQTLSGERKVEVFTSYNNPMLEINEFGEYRWTWVEELKTEQIQTITEEEEIIRTYYLGRDRNNQLKITAISIG